MRPKRVFLIDYATDLIQVYRDSYIPQDKKSRNLKRATIYEELIVGVVGKERGDDSVAIYTVMVPATRGST